MSLLVSQSWLLQLRLPRPHSTWQNDPVLKILNKGQIDGSNKRTKNRHYYKIEHFKLFTQHERNRNTEHIWSIYENSYKKCLNSPQRQNRNQDSTRVMHPKTEDGFHIVDLCILKIFILQYLHLALAFSLVTLSKYMTTEKTLAISFHEEFITWTLNKTCN